MTGSGDVGPDVGPGTPAARMVTVSRSFRGTQALRDVSLTLPRDGITGLLGRNGAGKTTIMRLLTGHLRADSGRVLLDGEDPFDNAPVLARTCFVREGQKYPDGITVAQVLRSGALVLPGWDDAYARTLAADFGLPQRRAVTKLSRGMLSAVGVVVGLASRAPVTFFDEPYLGLDAVARQLFYDRLLADYAEHPRTVLLSTHLIEEISDLLEHVLLIDRGSVLLDSDAESLRATALTVTGPARQVATFGSAHDVLHAESMAGQTRAVVRTSTAADRQVATDLGLAVEQTSIQKLVVALSRATADSATAPTAASAELEGITR